MLYQGQNLKKHPPPPPVDQESTLCTDLHVSIDSRLLKLYLCVIWLLYSLPLLFHFKMVQIIQPDRLLYVQASNTVEEREW